MSDEPTTDSHSEVPLITEGLERIGDFERYAQGTEITVATDDERINGQVAAVGDNDPLVYIAVNEYEGDPSPRIGATNDTDTPDIETDRIDEILLRAKVDGSSRCVLATAVNSDGRVVKWPFGRFGEVTVTNPLDPYQ